jgi:putative Ca2+/H+ antiporter (TMEM165/GDT1 family)
MGTFPELLVVFATIGVIELGDRTNFALIGFASRRSGLSTWAGAASAFLVSSTIAVVIGTIVLAFLAPDIRYVEVAGGLIILAYAAHLYFRPESAGASHTARSAFATAFLLILLLEMGDTTMILMVLFTGSLADPIGVFAAGASALLLVAAFACTVGRHLGRRIEPRRLDQVVVAILVIVGIATILLALDPALRPSFLG